MNMIILGALLCHGQVCHVSGELTPRVVERIVAESAKPGTYTVADRNRTYTITIKERK